MNETLEINILVNKLLEAEKKLVELKKSFGRGYTTDRIDEILKIIRGGKKS